MQELHTHKKKSLHTFDKEPFFINYKKLCRFRHTISMFLILIEGYRSVSYEWLLSKFPSTQLILTSFVSALEDSFPVHILGDWIVFVQHDSPPSFPCHCLFFHPFGCLLCLLFRLFRYVLCLFCLLRCLLCLYFSLFRYVLCLFFCFCIVLYLYFILHQIIIYQRNVRSIKLN